VNEKLKNRGLKPANTRKRFRIAGVKIMKSR
jgi:hypothetical protein